MSLHCGIVGLPNVGKSTIFNALTAAGAAVANYPFTTVSPHHGVVPVPDARLDRLHRFFPEKMKVPAMLDVVDIAGLVQGASRGAGLGNQFLAHIREVDALLHIVRCFDDPDVAHVMGEVDPRRDIAVIETELALADLETLGRRREKAEKRAKAGEKGAAEEIAFIKELEARINRGEVLPREGWTETAAAWLREWRLLTAKPVLFVANVDERGLTVPGPAVDAARDAAQRSGAEVVVLCGKVEAEIQALPEEEREEYLKALGIEEPGLLRLARAAYALLGLITFFTIGEQEVKAWTIHQGTRAQQAAGFIHSDMERGFIRAEVVTLDDLFAWGSLSAVREHGHLRQEGREYVIRDGEVMYFRFHV